MSEITSLVTAEAVKEVLRSEEVRSALKQKLRHNLEARLDAEVDAQSVSRKQTRRAAHLAATFLITPFDEKIPCQKLHPWSLLKQ